MSEIWKRYFDGFYEVSNKGEVRSIALWSSRYNKVIIRKKPLLLKQETTHDGYKRVVICMYGKKRHYAVHRLVAEVFIENPKNLPCVNHKDENTKNNCVDNLEWCTWKENSNYGTLPKRISKRMKDNHPSAKIVYQFDNDMNLIAEYKTAKEAAEKVGNVSADMIRRACLGKAKSAGGFLWSYVLYRSEPYNV